MENQATIKIPLELINQFKLSDTQLIIYGELLGIWNKYGQDNCHISNATLAKRLNKGLTAIKDALRDLKSQNIISIQKIQSGRGRFIHPLLSFKSTPFLLIPTWLYNQAIINLRDAVVYGYLLSKYRQKQKIAKDSYQSDDILLEIRTKELSTMLNKSSDTIKRALTSLSEHNLIELYTLKGIGYEFKISEIKIFTEPKKKTAKTDPTRGQKPTKTPKMKKEEGKNRPYKRAKTDPFIPKKRAKTDLTRGQKPTTNRMLIESKNRDIEYSRPNSGLPPNIEKMINRIFTDKLDKGTTSDVKESKRKPLTHKPYNLDYLLKEIVKHLNTATNKKYSLASTRRILTTKIMQGYTLDDFKEYIDVNKDNCYRASDFFSTPFDNYFKNK